MDAAALRLICCGTAQVVEDMSVVSELKSDLTGASDAACGYGDLRWYVVQTIVRNESRADHHLRAQGFETFYPRVHRTVRHARKLRTVLSPAFPGYIFTRFDLARTRWRSVNGTFGVSRLIMANDKPAPVPRGLVETLVQYMDERGVAHFERDLVVGQSVRIKDGPLAQAVGKLIRLDANGRVRVLLEIMGGQVETGVGKASLEAA